MQSKRPLIGILLACTALTACVKAPPPVVSAPMGDPSAISINPDTKPGAVEIPDQNVPGLEDLVNAVPELSDTDAVNTEDMSPAERLRVPAMREAAMAYGVQGGLAYTANKINAMLRRRAGELTRLYDFNRLIMRGPDNTQLLPPVITGAKDAWESYDAGKALRTADETYEIIQQARFVPNAPLWHSYLVRAFDNPKQPAGELLPRNNAERKLWAKYVKMGWEQGVKQANEIFKVDMARLERDYTGMLRYKALAEEGKVARPVLAGADLGVTGSKTAMRVGDRTVRITQDPEFVLDTDKWQAGVSAETPERASQNDGHPDFETPDDLFSDIREGRANAEASLPASKTEPVTSAPVASVTANASGTMQPVADDPDREPSIDAAASAPAPSPAPTGVADTESAKRKWF